MTVIAIGTAIALAWMFALWCVQRRTRNAGIVDFGWTVAVGGLTILLAVAGPGEWPRRTLVAGMIGLWSLRLALHLWRDRIWRREEDGRYQQLRARWGAAADAHFLWFFAAQALLAWLFVMPPALAMQAERGVTFDGFDLAGVMIWLVAWFGEALADRQLKQFRDDPGHRGLTCRAGLWRYSRHPNYFCEWLHWWAYVAVAWGSSAAWLTLLGPMLMLLFLFKVTGIPHTEAQALVSRGDDYRRYQRETNMFFPWFPRKDRS